jgi:hypothetical protein
MDLNQFEPPKMSAGRVMGLAIRSVVLAAIVGAAATVVVEAAFGLPLFGS